MATVPKLNYANIRGKSKSKDSENSDRKLDNPSSDLFSHMNQDNLKYIQSQIKQKNRKNNQLALKRKSEEEEVPNNQYNYPQKIQEKQSKYEETERETSTFPIQQQQTSIIKTDGESMRFNLMGNEAYMQNRASQQAQTQKLSYYDLMSQAKSKRVPSLQGCLEQENQLQAAKEVGGRFINFLESYIKDLNSRSVKKKKIKSRNQTINKNQTINRSSSSERQILKNGIYEQKKKNQILAKELEMYKTSEENNKKRLQNLQQFVAKLSQELQSLRDELRKQKSNKRYMQQINLNQHYNQNYNTMHRQYPAQPYAYPNQHAHHQSLMTDHNRISHRKNKTISLTASSNDQRYANVTSKSYKPQVNEKQINELTQLEEQYELFKETGIVELYDKSGHYWGKNEFD